MSIKGRTCRWSSFYRVLAKYLKLGSCFIHRRDTAHAKLVDCFAKHLKDPLPLLLHIFVISCTNKAISEYSHKTRSIIYNWTGQRLGLCSTTQESLHLKLYKTADHSFSQRWTNPRNHRERETIGTSTGPPRSREQNHEFTIRPKKKPCGRIGCKPEQANPTPYQQQHSLRLLKALLTENASDSGQELVLGFAAAVLKFGSVRTCLHLRLPRLSGTMCA